MHYRSLPNFRLLDPTGISEGVAVAGVVAAVASAGVGIASAANTAANQQKAANYNATVQANDAQVAVWQRQQQEQEFAAQSLVTQQQGARTSSALDLRNNMLVARNIDAAASSGLAITGSTQDSIFGSAANNDLDVLNNQYSTQLEAWQNQIGSSNASYNSVIEANRYSDQSILDTMQGGFAQQSSLFSEAGSVVGGFGGAVQGLSSSGGQTFLRKTANGTLFD